MGKNHQVFHEISEHKEKIIDYLAGNQKPNGEFESLQSVQTNHSDSKEWHYLDPSPFIQANILYSLMHVEGDKVRSIIEKGIEFLISLMEAKGFWRFWPHGGQTHNVPLDMDDTCLCSLVLEKYGINISNKKKLLKNIDNEGYFRTWILPGWEFFWNPKFSRFLLKDQKYTRDTIDSFMMAVEDREPGVAANVLSYLGSNNQTRRCIDQIILEIESNNFSGQYYKDPLFTYYHVSRARVEGVEPFDDLRELIISYVDKRWEEEDSNIFETIIMSLTVLNYGISSSKYLDQWMELIVRYARNQSEWECYTYFTSKDQNFSAGSPFLTAALALQVLDSYKKESQV